MVTCWGTFTFVVAIILDATLVVIVGAALKASVVVTLFASRLLMSDEGVVMGEVLAGRLVWLCTWFCWTTFGRFCGGWAITIMFSPVWLLSTCCSIGPDALFGCCCCGWCCCCCVCWNYWLHCYWCEIALHSPMFLSRAVKKIFVFLLFLENKLW